MTLKNFNTLSIVKNQGIVRFIATFLLMAPSILHASDWQAALKQSLLQQWQSLAADSGRADISMVGISDHYQLPACKQPPQMRLNKALQPGRNALELTCTSPYWRQNFAVRLHVYRQVVVLTQPIRNRQVLAREQIHVTEQDIGTLNKGFFSDPAQVIGMEAKRGLPPGTVISPDMLAPPLLVKRGEKVIIRVNRPGIKVEMDGQAMGAGQAGKQIRVKNLQSNKIIRATVIARGLVQVQ